MLEKKDYLIHQLYNVYKDCLSLNRFLYKNYLILDIQAAVTRFTSINLFTPKDIFSYDHLEMTMNTVHYAINSVLNQVPENKDLIKKIKKDQYAQILDAKKNWKNLALKVGKRKVPNRFIDKEIYESLKKEPALLTKAVYQKIYEAGEKKIDDWFDDPKALLSSFPYEKDLYFKQRQLIAEKEVLYLLLKRIEEDEKLLELINEYKQSTQQIFLPESLLKNDEEFIYDNRKIEDYKALGLAMVDSEKQGFIRLLPKGKADFYELIEDVPALSDVDLGISVDMDEMVISSGAFSLKMLFNVLQLGIGELLQGRNKITFTLKELCEIEGLDARDLYYRKIERALLLAKSKTVMKKIGDGIFYTNHISTIFIPDANENGEKRLTVTVGEHLVEDLVQQKYRILLKNQFNHLRGNLAVLLYRLILKDLKEQTISLDYSWDSLRDRAQIPGSITTVKKRIVAALDEIVSIENSLIASYKTDGRKNRFLLLINETSLAQVLEREKKLIESATKK